MYHLKLSEKAQRDLRNYERAGNKLLIKKVYSLFEEIVSDPYTGTGKPERLKHLGGNTWSRRVDNKNRMVYSIEESVITVTVISAAGHYGNK